MKNIITSIILTAAAALDLSAAEVVVYSSRTNEMIHVAPIVSGTNELTRFGKVYSLPKPSTSHRSVISVSETNGPFAAWAGGETYRIGDPFGCSTGRDYNAIELTDTSVITPRINLYTGQTDRPYTIEQCYSNIIQDVYDAGYTDSGTERELDRCRTWMTKNVIKSPPVHYNDKVRVRVVSWLVDDYYPVYKLTTDLRLKYEIMVDRYVAWNESAILTESDFFSQATPDIHFNTLTNMQEAITPSNPVGFNLHAMSYLIAIGDGPFMWSDENDTNTVVKALPVIIRREFGVYPPKANAVTFGGTVNLSMSTHRFSFDGLDTSVQVRPKSGIPRFMFDNEDRNESTAFEMCIQSGNETVWSSGQLRLPPRDRDRKYVYSAPSLEGMLSPGTYTWKVRLLNSLHRDSPWSQPATVTFE